MKYLDATSLLKIGIDWDSLTETVEEAVICLHEDKTVQPIKPYLRFKDPKNRIISMPAYLGNNFDVAGIKWIASFPDNINKNIPRAHSLTILNSADTGEPICIINTSLVSVIRTVSVSRLVLKHYQKHRNLEKVKIGITGFGPIGQYHFKMLQDFFKDVQSEFLLFDLKGIDNDLISEYDNVSIASNWEEAYHNADVFVTCTVSNDRYIDKAPKENSLHLNVSLRDYRPETIEYFKNGIIVDKWEEICRENTDIELMHKKFDLNKSDTKSIVDVVVSDSISTMIHRSPIMFNPMGMSIFDIAVAKVFYDKAMALGKGINL